MRVDSTFRVLWLLNHSSARKFELSVMHRLGITEVFTPKSYPQELSFRSASIAVGEENRLSIPADDLAILNSTDWYRRPSQQAWDIANKYFDVAFFIFYSSDFFENICDKFKGAIVWRVYGRTSDLNYSKILETYTKGKHRKAITNAGRRFWFGESYSHLHEIEADYLQKRSVFLPLGLANSEVSDKWTGSIKKIYFVCPDISVHASYKSYYDNFLQAFSGLPYAIGGTQGLPVNDPNVLGYVSEEQHHANMAGFRVMFYHSTEPNHIHYHPFEAIRAGMPLVFMAGGMLDRMGGINLPGRCTSLPEAREKLERILNGDQKLINKIRDTQIALLQDMQIDRLEPHWRAGMAKIREELTAYREEVAVRPTLEKPTRIALIIPARQTLAHLKKATSIAKAIHRGSELLGEQLELVILYQDDHESLATNPTVDMPPNTRLRPYRWKSIERSEALRAMTYSGFADWQPEHSLYGIIDDGIAQLNDCDLWIFLSDTISTPIIPMRPTALLTDRIEWGNAQKSSTQERLSAIRSINYFITTTDAAYCSITQDIGVNPNRIIRAPFLLPTPKPKRPTAKLNSKKSFVWVTEKITKHSAWIIEALRIYYDQLDGGINCSIVMQNPNTCLAENTFSLKKLLCKQKAEKLLNKKICIALQDPDQELDELISHADYILVPEPYSADIHDLLEWAQAGQHLLIYKDASLLELENKISLQCTWLKSFDPISLAKQLKNLEAPLRDLDKKAFDTSSAPLSFDSDRAASAYWKVIRECL